MDTGDRRGACDRCRGQKLRCVGSAKPILISGSRFQRNQIACDRCKRAKVECYSARPVSRRTSTPLRNHEKRAGIQQRSQSATVKPPHHGGSLFNSSVSSPSDQLADGQAQDIGALASVPTPSTPWAYNQNGDGIEWSHMDLETPIWMLDSDLALHQDEAINNLDNSSMIDLADKPAVDWNSERFDLDTSSDHTRTWESVSSTATAKHSLPMYSSTKPSNRSRPLVEGSVPNVESNKSCVQELAELNELLLREKSSVKDSCIQKTSGQHIGQVLHRCQEFLSILRRLHQSNSDSQRSGPASEISYSSDETDSRSYSVSSTLSSPRRPSLALPTPVASSLEIPTLLSVLSCYAYILQSFDDLFTPILDSVTGSSSTVPVILPGLLLDGFELDSHYILQLECLTSVSLNMLEKIEIILIGSPRTGGLFSQTRSGLLQDKLFAGLIDALYDQRGQNTCNGKRQVRAKRLIREIQAQLKVIDL